MEAKLSTFSSTHYIGSTYSADRPFADAFYVETITTLYGSCDKPVSWTAAAQSKAQEHGHMLPPELSAYPSANIACMIIHAATIAE